MLKLLIVSVSGWRAHNTMHINAAVSASSPPGVSQMSVNIQLFPLHLTLISLWWHFISLPLAALPGSDPQKTASLCSNPEKHKKIQIQVNKERILLSKTGAIFFFLLLFLCFYDDSEENVSKNEWGTFKTLFLQWLNPRLYRRQTISGSLTKLIHPVTIDHVCDL